MQKVEAFLGSRVWAAPLCGGPVTHAAQNEPPHSGAPAGKTVTSNAGSARVPTLLPHPEGPQRPSESSAS